MKKTVVSYDTKEQTITEREYHAFQVAYDFLNAELFGGSLPHVLVTFQRHAKAKGYFVADRFEGRGEKVTAHELAMNPDVFTNRTDQEILSTLAHEMVHVWQQVHGKPPRRAYHDKQWAGKMKEVGLYPTDTGAPGGKETGQSVTHYIIEGGAYQIAFAKLAATGFKLNWQSLPLTAERKKKAASKTKYTCGTCGANAWAKPETSLICGTCYEDEDEEGERVISVMVAEERDDEENQEAA